MELCGQSHINQMELFGQSHINQMELFGQSYISHVVGMGRYIHQILNSKIVYEILQIKR
jgi:hypothetical protein